MVYGQPLNHELSKILNEIWDADVNRFVPGKDYTISLQGKAGFVRQGTDVARDNAPEPLFSNVNERRLKKTETYSTFIPLLDNYKESTGVSEVVTPEERAENHRFLDAILKTDVMKLAHRYLVGKKRTKPGLKDFKSHLYEIWFELYSSGGNILDTCGFEHVFVGETKGGYKILGLHNWVQFYLQEKLKNIDYKGYVARKNKSRPDEYDQVLSFQFAWKGIVKPLVSTFIGVSPEFEIALYTIIFLESNEHEIRRRVNIEEYELEIVVYRHGRHMGSAYPVLLSCGEHLPVHTNSGGGVVKSTGLYPSLPKPTFFPVLVDPAPRRPPPAPLPAPLPPPAPRPTFVYPTYTRTRRRRRSCCCCC